MRVASFWNGGSAHAYLHDIDQSRMDLRPLAVREFKGLGCSESIAAGVVNLEDVPIALLLKARA